LVLRSEEKTKIEKFDDRVLKGIFQPTQEDGENYMIIRALQALLLLNYNKMDGTQHTQDKCEIHKTVGPKTQEKKSR
jgi:hypothetical protein